MNEELIKAWFAAHPFIRNECILILGAWSGLAKADWASFKEYRETNPDATFSARVALIKYSHALIIAGAPPLIAEIWNILGAAAPAVMVSLRWAMVHLALG